MIKKPDNENDVIELLERNLKTCAMQASSLAISLDEVNKLTPFSKEILENLSEENRKSIDAFILRFGRLQDIMGSKIFRGVITAAFEEAGSMIDVMNKMEKYYIIDDADEWRNIRAARNNVIHDYDFQSDKISENLSHLVFFTPKLLEIFIKAKEYAKTHFNINMEE